MTLTTTGRSFVVTLGAVLAAQAAATQDVAFRAGIAETRALTPQEEQAIVAGVKWQPALMALPAVGASGASTLVDAQGRTLAGVNVTWAAFEPPKALPRTGRELFDWRRQRSLSIDQLAKATGVGTIEITTSESTPAANLPARLRTALGKAYGTAGRATFDVTVDNKSLCALNTGAEIRVTGDPKGIVVDRTTWSGWLPQHPAGGQSSGPAKHDVTVPRAKAVPLEVALDASGALTQCRTAQVRQAVAPAPAPTAGRARRQEDRRAEDKKAEDARKAADKKAEEARKDEAKRAEAAKKAEARAMPTARAGSAAAEPKGGGLSLYTIGGVVLAGGAYAALARSAADPVDPPSIAPLEFGGRPVAVQGTVVVTNTAVTFELRDNGQVDGDFVTFVVNGTPLVTNVRLTDATLRLSANLNPGNNFALIFVNSEGTEPPNTTSVRIDDGASQQFLTPMSGSLTTSGAFNVIVRP